MYWTLERSSEIFRKPRKIFETRAPGASAQCPRECFCFLSVRVMRRVETVRNNSRGRFVEKLDTDHSIDPRPQDDVRGSTKLNTQNGFSPNFFLPLWASVGGRGPPRRPRRGLQGEDRFRQISCRLAAIKPLRQTRLSAAPGTTRDAKSAMSTSPESRETRRRTQPGR